MVSTPPSSRRLTVDGEVFEVRPSEHHQGYDFDWVSGPNSGYGFSGNGSSMDDQALAAQIRSFLQQIDPATGYIAD
jgi:hypothetical protein